jgi:ABC-type phosphate transport system auxiliary subunit
MPFKPWVTKISPLAWILGASAAANIITMIGVLYIAFGTPKVYVRDGYVDAYVRNQIDLRDRTPVRVQVVP